MRNWRLRTLPIHRHPTKQLINMSNGQVADATARAIKVRRAAAPCTAPAASLRHAAGCLISRPNPLRLCDMQRGT